MKTVRAEDVIKSINLILDLKHWAFDELKFKNRLKAARINKVAERLMKKQGRVVSMPSIEKIKP